MTPQEMTEYYKSQAQAMTNDQLRYAEHDASKAASLAQGMGHSTIRYTIEANVYYYEMTMRHIISG